jgi:hypothetical protein
VEKYCSSCALMLDVVALGYGIDVQFDKLKVQKRQAEPWWDENVGQADVYEEETVTTKQDNRAPVTEMFEME